MQIFSQEVYKRKPTIISLGRLYTSVLGSSSTCCLLKNNHIVLSQFICIFNQKLPENISPVFTFIMELYLRNYTGGLFTPDVILYTIGLTLHGPVTWGDSVKSLRSQPAWAASNLTGLHLHSWLLGLWKDLSALEFGVKDKNDIFRMIEQSRNSFLHPPSSLVFPFLVHLSPLHTIEFCVCARECIHACNCIYLFLTLLSNLDI